VSFCNCLDFFLIRSLVIRKLDFQELVSSLLAFDLQEVNNIVSNTNAQPFEQPSKVVFHAKRLDSDADG
jgi:hypothetical protein